MKRALAVFVSTSLVAALAVAGPEAEPTNAELAKGVREVNEGDFEAGLLTLDAVARHLASRPDQTADLARAYLYLGVAYAGLRQDALAEAKFRQALRHDPALRPSPDEFPPKVLRLFEEARQALSEAAVLEREASRKRGAGGLVVLGLGSAAAAAIAVAAAQPAGAANTAPVASLTVAPDGQALVHATRLTFVGSATDGEGDPLSFNWTFGDGTSGSGPTVTHIYTTEGVFNVTLTVSDGSSSATAETSITARTLTGRWRTAGVGLQGTVGFRLVQTGASLSGFEDRAASASEICNLWSCPVTAPRHVTLFLGQVYSFRAPCRREIEGDLDPTLSVLQGVETCSGCVSCETPSQAPIILRRE